MCRKHCKVDAACHFSIRICCKHNSKLCSPFVVDFVFSALNSSDFSSKFTDCHLSSDLHKIHISQQKVVRYSSRLLYSVQCSETAQIWTLKLFQKIRRQQNRKKTEKKIRLSKQRGKKILENKTQIF